MATRDSEVVRDVDEAVRGLEGDSKVALDLETTGFSPFTDRIAVVSLRGKESGTRAVLHVRGRLPERLARFVDRPDGPLIITHNGTSFDIPYLARNGVDVFKARWWDTMTGELANLSSQRRDVSVSLKATTQRRVGKTLKKDQDHSGWMNEELDEGQLGYAVDDVDYLIPVQEKQLELASGTSKERALDVEMRLIPAVVSMELTGLPISEAYGTTVLVGGTPREVLVHAFERRVLT